MPRLSGLPRERLSHLDTICSRSSPFSITAGEAGKAAPDRYAG